MTGEIRIENHGRVLPALDDAGCPTEVESSHTDVVVLEGGMVISESRRKMLGLGITARRASGVFDEDLLGEDPATTGKAQPSRYANPRNSMPKRPRLLG